VLPDLIAGMGVVLEGTPVELSPRFAVPPILVGGAADAALAGAARHDGWFALPLPPPQLVPLVDRLGDLAADLGRSRPAITASAMVALDGDPGLPDHDGLVRLLSDPDGVYGMPAEAVPDMIVTGGPAAVAERIDALGALGAERVVFTLAAGTWSRQAELLAEAVALAGEK
jgi:alkanesulfonate monooxygenase SsuD/methylene tetrahydromethanopterin reductase-like flavin-dependent oxidoreductase (luciferase family)